MLRAVAITPLITFCTCIVYARNVIYLFTFNDHSSQSMSRDQMWLNRRRCQERGKFISIDGVKWRHS